MFSTRDRRNQRLGELMGEKDNDSAFMDEDLNHIMSKLERLLTKESKMWWEVATLEKYVAEDKIPKGLCIDKEASFETVIKNNKKR